MLHNLVAPVMILAAYICIECSWGFFASFEQLFQTESEYSSNGRINEMYIRSRAVRLTLNLRVLIRFNLVIAFLVIHVLWI